MALLISELTRTIYVHSIKATPEEAEAIHATLKAEGIGKCFKDTGLYPGRNCERLIEIREVLGGPDPIRLLRQKKLIQVLEE